MEMEGKQKIEKNIFFGPPPTSLFSNDTIFSRVRTAGPETVPTNQICKIVISDVEDDVSDNYQDDMSHMDGDMIGMASIHSAYNIRKKILSVTLKKIKFYTDDFYRAGLYVRYVFIFSSIEAT